MQGDFSLVFSILFSLLAAAVLSFGATPLVKRAAFKLGAIDVPKDGRRMHDHPIPRLGGLAIFLGFMLSALLFAEMERPVRGLLIGAVIIVILGVLDDIMTLRALPKFIVQIGAAWIAVHHGNVIQYLSNPILTSTERFIDLGSLAVPVTILWIVAITNAVNFIDGLDGLAVGVSAISSATLLVTAILVSEGNVAVIMAALLGACLGFIPYNMNPAKIFMGDSGSTFLGYVLAVVSIQGLFKLYAIISFAVPFLILGLPIFDICFAILRRLARGENPMHADRGHVHHRLIDMGFNQKQAVAISYIMTAILGLSAVVLTSSGALRALFLIGAVFVVGAIGLRLIFSGHGEERHEGPMVEDSSHTERLKAWEPRRAKTEELPKETQTVEQPSEEAETLENGEEDNDAEV
ncbi:MAG: undecaprenyl/decaprenyl-phosphate alpha-N-acetylglucosaminyl 1-phosphate transferase [Oscillospiraceae bacterium]|nr:undecaprenyl/decaprenyl-phosphate alpha-N-acetylglucosaminyl 1-phosphate transferase [Oscillospiraceae bacterium]